MRSFINTGIGRLRLAAFAEGFSLLVLLFIAVPVKYITGEPMLVSGIGPIHGALVLLYLFNAFSSAVEYRWKFSRVTWKIIVACLVPFGTFYVDHTYLRPLFIARVKSERDRPGLQ